MSNNNTPSKGELQSALERIAPCVNTEKAREAFEMVRAFISGAPDAANAGEPAEARMCVYCSRNMIAGSECTSYVQSTSCGMDAPRANATGVAADESTRAPDGWKLVPIKSTVEMDKAGQRALPADCRELDAECCWDAMLAAAPPSGERPSAPAPEGEKQQ